MRAQEVEACSAGLVKLGVDAAIALTSMAIAVPVAFAIGEGEAMGRAASGRIPTIAPDPKTHDLGTIVTHR